MKKNLFHRLSDISRIHHRAAFRDVHQRITPKSSSFLKLAGERYSCRAFTDRTVPEEALDQILEAGKLAPTAVDKQPVHIWAVRSPEVLAKLGEATQYLFGATLVLVVGCQPDEAWVRKYDGKNGAEVDAAIVGTHLMLEIADLGLGTTWVGSFDPVKVKEALDMGGYEPVALFPVGYPAGEPSPRHSVRKPLDELVTRL